jgi:hypothetical protein
MIENKITQRTYTKRVVLVTRHSSLSKYFSIPKIVNLAYRTPSVATDFLLLETGDFLLMETGDKIGME